MKNTSSMLHLRRSIPTEAEEACSQHKPPPLPGETTRPEGIRQCTPAPQTYRTPKCTEHGGTRAALRNADMGGDASSAASRCCTHAWGHAVAGNNTFFPKACALVMRHCPWAS